MELAAVIAKYTALVNGGASGAVQTAHQRLFGLAEVNFPQIARNLLESWASTEMDRRLTTTWLETFTAVLEGTQSRYMLGEVPDIPKEFAKGGEFAGPMGMATEAEQLQAVEDWVRAGWEKGANNPIDGKVIDGGRDTDLEDTIRRMQGILVYARGKSFGPAQVAAREKYFPFINAFLAANKAIGDRENTSLTLRHFRLAILDAWRQYVQVAWPSLLLGELEKRGLPKEAA